jgi:hypothetical protein
MHDLFDVMEFLRYVALCGLSIITFMSWCVAKKQYGALATMLMVGVLCLVFLAFGAPY